MGLLLKGATVISLDPICVEKVDLRVEGDRVVARGDRIAAPGRALWLRSRYLELSVNLEFWRTMRACLAPRVLDWSLSSRMVSRHGWLWALDSLKLEPRV